MGSTTDSPKAFSYFKQQQQTFKPPLLANENAFLGDIASSAKNNPDKPVSCGLYRLEKGRPPPFSPPPLLAKPKKSGLIPCRHPPSLRIHLRRNENHPRRPL